MQINVFFTACQSAHMIEATCDADASSAEHMLGTHLIVMRHAVTRVLQSTHIRHLLT